jgi:hypothetical protein
MNSNTAAVLSQSCGSSVLLRTLDVFVVVPLTRVEIIAYGDIPEAKPAAVGQFLSFYVEWSYRRFVTELL